MRPRQSPRRKRHGCRHWAATRLPSSLIPSRLPPLHAPQAQRRTLSGRSGRTPERILPLAPGQVVLPALGFNLAPSACSIRERLCPFLPTRPHELPLPSEFQERQPLRGSCSDALARTRLEEEPSSNTPGRRGTTAQLPGSPHPHALLPEPAFPAPQRSQVSGFWWV